MAKTWVLDTETKGTGAHMVPLEKLLQQPAKERDLATITLAPQPSRDPVEPPEPPVPLRFKVVDVLGARELARDISLRAALGLLEDMSTVLDARVYVWMPIPQRYSSSMDFTKDLLDKTGVVVAPGTGFGAAGEGYVRVSLCDTEARLREAGLRMAKANLRY